VCVCFANIPTHLTSHTFFVCEVKCVGKFAYRNVRCPFCVCEVRCVAVCCSVGSSLYRLVSLAFRELQCVAVCEVRCVCVCVCVCFVVGTSAYRMA